MAGELVLGIIPGGAAELSIDAQVMSRKRRQSWRWRDSNVARDSDGGGDGDGDGALRCGGGGFEGMSLGSMHFWAD